VKYAHLEIERRFLLDAVPTEVGAPRQITDHYITGTQLRLRKVEQAGMPAVYKLGHKHRPEPDDAVVAFHTTIYLTEAEYTLLRELPARELTKTRYAVAIDGGAAVVDEFHEQLEGLVLLEVGFESRADSEQFRPPPWVGVETALSGGELALMSSSELRARLAAP
jgi:CYTH domain-containing protein